MKAFLCLGTPSEVVGILPIVQHEFETTKEKPMLVLSQRLMGWELSPFSMVTYSFEDFPNALARVKRTFESVTAFPSRLDATVEHRHPSHQFDQWDRAGVLHLWRKLPLTLPRPANAAELVKEHIGVEPTILLADDDPERPFPFRDELHQALMEEFPLHQIVRLANLQLPHLLDYLALYDAADLIVCAETVHLQLSRASATPVLAIANDQPSPWHGSAPHPRFKWYGHYSSFGATP